MGAGAAEEMTSTQRHESHQARKAIPGYSYWGGVALMQEPDMSSTKEHPTTARRWAFAVVVSAATSFAIGGLVYLAGWLAKFGSQDMPHMAEVDPEHAINATCVLFWIVLAILYFTHVHQNDEDRNDERRALIAEAWLKTGRRASLLRAQSRRR